MEENIKYNVEVEGSDSLNNLKTKLDEVAQSNKQADERAKQVIGTFKDVGKTASGLASSLTALKGVQSLLGIENENLQKTFVQLQAGMAIAAGANGIGDVVEGGYAMVKSLKASETYIKLVTVAQKAWNFVMSQNPILLVVTGILALTGAIAGLVS